MRAERTPNEGEEDEYAQYLASDDWEQELETLPIASTSTAVHSTRGKRDASEDRTSPNLRAEACYGETGFGEMGEYMRNKRLKLSIQNDTKLNENRGLPQIFQKCGIYVNGHTGTRSLKEIVGMIVTYGGTYVPYLDRKLLATHVIATNLTPAKRKQYVGLKVVTPAWIEESVKAERLLRWQDFALPDEDDVGGRLGAGDGEAIPTGTMAPQMKLDAFVRNRGGKGKGKEVERERNGGYDKLELTESMDDLSDLGIRLTEAANRSAKPKSDSFFAPKSTSANSSPTKSHAPLAATTSHFPSKKPDRTATLMSDPEWLAKHTAISSDFLETYVSNSRLHHLSTWKQELKDLVAEVQSDFPRPTRKVPLTGGPADAKTRTVFHVDFDCFFVAAGLVSRPHLKGKPVAVCHGGGEGETSSSEIASCSYEARAFDIKAGMTLGRAREQCPELEIIPFEFNVYKEIASLFYSIVFPYADFLQAVSVDEVLFEVATSKLPSTRIYSPDPALELAHQLRAEILKATKCSASVGVSHNILLAKLATRKAKPGSAFHLVTEQIPEFLNPLKIDDLPGFGRERASKLEETMRVKTVGDLLRQTLSGLKRVLGDGNGDVLYSYARGIDKKELEGVKPRGSLSLEVNYGIRFTENEQVEVFIGRMAQEVSKRLKEGDYTSRQLTLKIMQRHPDSPLDPPKFLGHGRCTSLTETKAISSPTDDETVIGLSAWKLLATLKIPPRDLRGIAISMSKLLKHGKAPVEVESGQTMLSFGVATRTTDFTPAPPVSDIPAKVPPPPPPRPSSPPPPRPIASTSGGRTLRPRNPSIIIISDSDSDHSTSPPPPPPAPALNFPVVSKRNNSAPPTKSTKLGKPTKSTKSAKAVEAKIPSMFVVGKVPKGKEKEKLQTLPQLSDEDLKHFNIDPGFFRGVTIEDQLSIWSEKKKSTKYLRWLEDRDTKAAVVSKKRAASTSATSPQKKANSTSPRKQGAPIVPLQPVSPETILAFGYDPEEFHQLPPAIQHEHIQERKKLKETLTVRGAAAPKTARRGGEVKEWKGPAPVLFSKRSDLDDIRDLLAQWVDLHDQPLGKEEEGLTKFLVKLVDRSLGRDAAKAEDILGWVDYLVQDKHGKEVDVQGDDGVAWWACFNRIRDRVSRKIRAEYGGR